MEIRIKSDLPDFTPAGQLLKTPAGQLLETLSEMPLPQLGVGWQVQQPLCGILSYFL